MRKKRSLCESPDFQEVKLINRFAHDESINDNNYAATDNCLSTQTNLNEDNISDLQDIKEHYQDKNTLKRKLFIQDITENDQQVTFYTGFQNVALLMSVLAISKERQINCVIVVTAMTKVLYNIATL
jgi:hypothetical protein